MQQKFSFEHKRSLVRILLKIFCSSFKCFGYYFILWPVVYEYTIYQIIVDVKMFRRFTKENLTRSSENNNYLICIRFYLVQVLCLWKQCELYICIDDTDQHRFEESNQRVKWLPSIIKHQPKQLSYLLPQHNICLF